MGVSDKELIFDDAVFIFETVMRVRNTEVDGGQYMTLESLTALLGEVRERFLYSKSIQGINTQSQGLLTDNLQLSIISQVRAREELLFEVGIEQLSDNGATLAIKVTRMQEGSLVAKGRQHMVNYDYYLNKVTTMTRTIHHALSPH